MSAVQHPTVAVLLQFVGMTRLGGLASIHALCSVQFSLQLRHDEVRVEAKHFCHQ